MDTMPDKRICIARRRWTTFTFGLPVSLEKAVKVSGAAEVNRRRMVPAFCILCRGSGMCKERENERKRDPEKVKTGEWSVEKAEGYFRRAPFEDLGYAKLDTHRKVRSGFAKWYSAAERRTITWSEYLSICTRKRGRFWNQSQQGAVCPH